MPDASASTPLLEQYEGVKARYPGHLVLFRVGDFYETFGDDARLLSRELDVVLTARAPDTRGERTPMAGVPHHAVEAYLGRLVRRGYKVALCDQVEDARFAKGLVRREVTRVVTPGTVVEDRILGGPDHSFLACVVLPPTGPGGYSIVDVSTGEWIRGEADEPGVEGLAGAIAPYQPREVLWHGGSDGPNSLASALASEFPAARVEEAPGPAADSELPDAIRPSGASPAHVRDADLRLAAYVRVTQPRLLPHLLPIEVADGGRRLLLDAKTLRHLEISRPMNPDDPRGTTLRDVWDETITAVGRRTLAIWLTNPLVELTAIAARLDAVQALVDRGAALEALRGRLRTIPDLARIGSRVAGRRVRPEELVALRRGLGAVREAAAELASAPLAGSLGPLLPGLEPPAQLEELLGRALPDEIAPGAAATELFRPGHAPDLDGYRAREAEALGALATLERSEQAATGIKGLRIGYNQVFGYYFEVARSQAARVPARFRRRQTVAQAERFVTDELEAIERRVSDARGQALASADARWEELLLEVDRHVGAVHRLSRAVGALDALATFAHLAQTRGYVRPTVDASTSIVIRDGRHPVLDRTLGERFVPNDVDLDAKSHRLLVLTGPNMSGKSTYMRQVGLLVVLAQAGSFVPARFARIGRVTRLFTRMGFTDEIGRGKSSFMVEMTEVAEILRAADRGSLVLLDEVGRGTSTFDGLAIAWATLRHLHDVSRSRSMVATHYHQLTDLVGGLRAARNGHLAVDERPEGIVFLHRLVAGATDRSYGVHVARLAGVPEDVLHEAERLLRQLEAGGIGLGPEATDRPRAGRKAPRYTQAVLVPSGASERDPLVQELLELPVLTLPPEELRAKLAALQRRAGGEGGAPP
jgi:DNA mismatch repair protein MutS